MNENFNSLDGRRLFKWGSWAMLLLAVFLAVQTLGAFKNLKGVSPAYNSISVSGHGEAVSIPDVATFNFSIRADAGTVGDAQKEVTTKLDAIMSALKSVGIDEKDITTSDYSVYPKYVYGRAVCGPTYCPPSTEKLDGYTARHTVTVKVRKTDDAGKALSAAGDNGATDISGVNFTLDDPDSVMTEARSEAIKDANTKAKALAKDLGVRIVRVVSYEDNSNNRPGPYYNTVSAQSVEKDAGAGVSVPVGENKNEVNVVVTYEIR